MEGTFASLFASILATYCVYVEDPLKANKDVSQEVVIAGCLDELARKECFRSIKLFWHMCTRVYPSLPVKFHRVHRIIAYHSCCGSYENVAQQCNVETAAVIN